MLTYLLHQSSPSDQCPRSHVVDDSAMIEMKSDILNFQFVIFIRGLGLEEAGGRGRLERERERVCVRACVRASVRARVRVCVRVCVCVCERERERERDVQQKACSHVWFQFVLKRQFQINAVLLPALSPLSRPLATFI